MILKYPPPASFLNLTSAKSGSMPVVSQSMTRPIVPVGASTVAWALRKPCCSPSANARSQLRRAAAANSVSGQFAASSGTGGIDNPSYVSAPPPACGGGGGGSPWARQGGGGGGALPP